MHLKQTLATGSQLLAAATALNVPLSRRANTPQKVDVPLLGRAYGLRYNVEVSFGGQDVELLVDTGSSDIFVVEDNYDCVGNAADDVYPESYCGWSSNLYTPTDTYTEIKDETFIADYGAGSARGTVGREDVAMGGLTVTDQKFGLVNMSQPMQLGGSGVLGLAYPWGTSAYETDSPNDTDPDTFTSDEKEIYNPLFVNMYKQNLTNPYFSMAIDRLPRGDEDGNGGTLTLGGMVSAEVEGDFVTVPVEHYDAIEMAFVNTTKQRVYWATTVEQVNYGSSDNKASWQAIVDTGAPMSLFPENLANQINNMLDPPGDYSELQGTYIIDCDVKVPDISVQLGGKTFKLHADDLVVYVGSESICLWGIAPALSMPDGAGGTIEYHILGLPFLRSVVSVFDFGNQQMKFASRPTTGASSRVVVTTGSWAIGLMTAMFILF